tara:strand:+ start:391 stop:603 length:213 start_codon:yes stop_codon:yes gene_type:complete
MYKKKPKLNRAYCKNSYFRTDDFISLSDAVISGLKKQSFSNAEIVEQLNLFRAELRAETEQKIKDHFKKK